MLDTLPLYDSAKDEQPEPLQPVEFTPDDPIEYTMSEPVKPQTSLFTPQTVIPDQTRIIPDVAVPVTEQSISVDAEKMLRYFSEPISKRVIEDLKKGVPLMPKVAEILIRKNIVRENTLSETQPATPEILLNSNPIVPEEKPKKKNPFIIRSFIDKTVDIIYNLIY